MAKSMNRREALAAIVVLVGVAAALLYVFRNVLMLFKTYPKGYLESNKNLMEELVETIIPETDTPGAKTAGTASFVIQKVNLYLTSREQRGFYKGLEDVRLYSIEKFGKAFSACSTDERVHVLTHMEGREWQRGGLLFRAKRKLIGRSFIDVLKTFTVEGYCISEMGCTRGLAYDPIPVQYLSCIDLDHAQRSWATK